MERLKIQEPTKDWIDYSSLSTYQTCPRQYYWQSILNIRGSGVAAALVNGSAYHEAADTYYEARKAGVSFEEAIRLGINAGRPHMEQIIDDPIRNLSTFTETFANYCLTWKDEPYQTLATEIGFAVDLDSFVFIGKIDRFVESPFGKMVGEMKTTTIVGDRWDKRGKPNLQIDGYFSAITIQTGEKLFGAFLDVIPIPYRKVSKKTGKATLVNPFRIITDRTDKDVDAWISNVTSWWKKIERDRDAHIWPCNTERCFPLLGYSCNYSTLCNMYPSPVSIDQIDLPSEYKIEEWKPWAIGTTEVVDA